MALGVINVLINREVFWLSILFLLSSFYLMIGNPTTISAPSLLHVAHRFIIIVLLRSSYIRCMVALISRKAL